MDAGWGEAAGQAIVMVATAIFALRSRRRQNTDMVVDQSKKVAQPMVASVADLETAVTGLRAMISAEGEKVRNLDNTMQDTKVQIKMLNERFERIEVSLPRVEDVLGKTLNFLERAKGGTLTEKPITGTGMTALKPKKE